MSMTKDLLFSVPGLLVTMLHNLLAIGFVAAWLMVQVYVLGYDLFADDPKPPTQVQKR